MLEPEGYLISEAENGRVALEEIEARRPDLLLLDLLMPEMDGFDVLEFLKKEKDQLPVVVLTADIQDSVKHECLELGAYAILNKPVGFAELKETIEKALDSSYAVK